MEKKIKAIKLTTFLICTLLFVCIIVLSFQFIKINNLKEKTENLETYKNKIINQINNYDAENSYYNNNRTEYLESYAREILGWGQEDEIWYTSQK